MYLISDGGINTNTLDTIEAIMLTKNMKEFDGIKLDVRKSLDNVFLTSRYNELEKLTYGKGNISDYNYSYLRKIKFPSHIFKYYIPTLEEVLINYDKKKIIVIELYSSNDLDLLYILLVKYPYKYYFLSNDELIINKLNELDFDKIGKVITKNEIINSVIKHDRYENTFLIKD